MESATVTGHKDLKTLMRYSTSDASKLAQRLDGDRQENKPFRAPHPGEKLREYLPTPSKIALISKQIAVSKGELAEIVAGRGRIDAELAVKFEVLGPRAEMWVEVQAHHDLQEVRRRMFAAEFSRRTSKSDTDVGRRHINYDRQR